VIQVESAYNYGFIRFYDEKNREYYQQPIDYVGETLFKTGNIKYIIKSIDSLKNTFEIISLYNEKKNSINN